MNARLLIGLVAVLLGIVILIYPQFLQIVVGLGLVLAGLYVALQNAPNNSNI